MPGEEYNLNLNIRKKLIITDAPGWRRVAAYIIDYLILNAMVLFPFNSMLSKLYTVNNFNEVISMALSAKTAFSPLMIYTSIAMGVISMLYFAICESRWTQTIGKMAMRIYAVSLDNIAAKTNNFRMSLWKSIIRALMVIFLFVFPPLAIFDIIYVYFNKERQRFFEKISNTKTISFSVI